MNGTRSAPVVALADSIIYLAALIADRPRSIDRHIDYFGEPWRPDSRRAS